MASYTEQGVVFASGEQRLVGVLTAPSTSVRLGVLIMVGGQQYRVGSHRQFTQLARHLGDAGIASLRFDHSGMGDSEGDRIGFDAAEKDIDAALVLLRQECPDIENVVLWGLCDAASCAMIVANKYADVAGLVLLNPWVHDGEHSPKVQLSHYYRPRLSEGHNWRRFLNRQIKLGPALREFGKALLALAQRRGKTGFAQQPFVQQMLEGLEQFEGQSLVVLSEDDLTAREFSELVAGESAWQRVLNNEKVIMRTIEKADHTFSSRPHQTQVEKITSDWLARLS